MPNLSGSFSGRAAAQPALVLHDVSNHDLNLIEVRGVQKSPDEKWNDCKITYWGTADLIAGSGTQSGYFVNDHPDGDRDFGTFEGRIAHFRRRSDPRRHMEIYRRHGKVQGS